MYKIYMLYNNFNNKCYIGVTKNSLKRRFANGKGYTNNKLLYEDIMKYGWCNFSSKVLATTSNRDDAGILEHYYINKYDTIRNGYNLHEGGFHNYKTHRRGIHASVKTEFKKGEIHYPPKKVICVETNTIYDSIADASNALSLGHHIGECCIGKRKTCGGFHWRFVKEDGE